MKKGERGEKWGNRVREINLTLLGTSKKEPVIFLSTNHLMI